MKSFHQTASQSLRPFIMTLCLVVFSLFIISSAGRVNGDSNALTVSTAAPALASLIIRQTPEEPVVIEGIPLQLDCQLEHFEREEDSSSASSVNASSITSTVFGLIPTQLCFQWFLNGQPISDDPRRYQNGPRLHIASVRHSLDLGEYKCSVSDSNSGLRIQSDPFVLNILCKCPSLNALKLSRPST